MKQTTEKAHATFGASSAKRWLNCFGSTALIAKAPPQRENDYAKEGTDAHACLEFILKNRKANAVVVYKTLRRTYPEEMIQHAQEAAELILELAGSNELQVEQKVDASPFTRPGEFGTLDAAIIEEWGGLTVIDFKYGAGILVDPKDNPQLIYYALALSHKYAHNFNAVNLMVIQPRAYSPDGETARSHIMPMSELLEWEPRFKSAVAKSLEPHAELLPDPEWCRFCPAATICPAIKNKAMETAAIVFDDATGQVESLPVPEMIQLPNLGSVLTACDQIEAWTARVREHALHVLERGGEVEGWKLVEKRSTRKWTDPVKATTEAKKLFGGKAFSVPELLSPAQIEKACGSTLAKEWVGKNTSSLSSGTTMAPESDKRPAVKPIEKVFSIVDESGREEVEPKKAPKKLKAPEKSKTRKK